MSDTPAKTKTKAKKIKAPTVVNAKELKAWLRGIQEFQPDGWVPSVEQWDAIRERIFLLEETEFHTTYSDAGNQGYYVEEPRFNPTPAYSVAPAPAYTAVVAPGQGALGGAPAPHQGGGLATSHSPTESGVVSVSSASEVIEGEYRSKFS
jgi:hypothetical protein